MKNGSRDSFDKSNAVVALGVWLATVSIYSLTRAATLSFWDCGEFITASYVLGIPHPPGTPLYVLVGRLFSFLPLASDLAARINMLSAVSSSVAAVFAYLSGVRILRQWFDPDNSPYTRLLIYGGAASGAFFFAFGLTNWTNSVEAEVYGLSMMYMTAILWLLLVYYQNRGTAWADRIMLLVVFLCFAGIGVHMTTFLIFPVTALVFIIKKGARDSTWYTMAILLAFELYLVFALSSEPGEIPYYLPVGVVFLFLLFYMFSFETIPRSFLLVAGGLAVALAPAYLVLARAVRVAMDPSVVAVGDTPEALETLGYLALVALFCYGLYCLYRYFNRKTPRVQKAQNLAAALFILAAILMVLLLYVPKGYKPFLVITAIAGAIALYTQRRHIHWPLLVALASSALVILDMRSFAYGLVIGSALILVLGLAGRQRGWQTALAAIVIAVTGFSVHLYIPIRSAQQPSLNENNPSESLETTIRYLERKQYGSQSMVERMFKRRAEWTHQFGNYRRMGFWGFFQDQYGVSGPRFVMLLLLGVFGLWEIARRKPRVGLPFIVLLLIATVGLILYMNFADGTRQGGGVAGDRLEVRDRDYFFTCGFVYFGMAMGLGSALAIQYLRGLVAKFSAVPRQVILSAGLVLLLLPSLAIARNYHRCDRSNNYIPYDYAWNLLQSAEPNAVLFTNGDNDTFPLWCLQDVYGIRTDVRIVNLSLANLGWYIKQVQGRMGVDLGWSDRHIDALRPFHIPDSAALAARGAIVDKSVYRYLGLSERETDSIFRVHGVPYGTTMRIQAQVIDKILYNHLGHTPVNFAVTAGAGNRKYLGRNIDSLLSLQGMAWRVNETGTAIRADMQASLDFFTGPDGFSARGVNDPTIYKNGTTRRLTQNWANGFLIVADSLRALGSIDASARLVESALERIPHSVDAVNFLATLYSQHARVDELQALIDKAQVGDRKSLLVLLAQTCRDVGDDVRAQTILEGLLREDRGYRAAFDELLRMYYEEKQVSKMKALFEQWLQFNPDDSNVKLMLQDLQRRGGTEDSTGGGSK